MEKIFYSWQSDRPNSCNRGFILEALERAAKTIRKDDTFEVEPVIDRDTDGVPGSPDIANTIFDKINSAHVFVCDVSFINSTGDSRLTPNPNVLVELGYAVKALGWERVIMVINTAYGNVKQLPFDLVGRRAVAYNMPEDATEKATERKKLEGMLEAHLRSIFQHHKASIVEPIVPPSLLDVAIKSLETDSPLKNRDVRRYCQWVVEQLDTINPFGGGWGEPKLYDSDNQEFLARHVEVFQRAIEASDAITLGFNSITQAIAVLNSDEASVMIYEMFANFIERFNTRRGFNGWYSDYSFDFFKFASYEMFIVFIANLMREGRWELIDKVLSHHLYIENNDEGRSESVNFVRIARFPLAVDAWNRSLRQDGSRHWIMPLGQFMEQRFKSESFVGHITIEEFADAEKFLYLRSFIDSNPSDAVEIDVWVPWSLLAVRRLPPFLVRSESYMYASKLAKGLGIESVNSLGTKLAEALSYLAANLPQVRDFEWPFRGFDPEKIGKR